MLPVSVDVSGVYSEESPRLEGAVAVASLGRQVALRAAWPPWGAEEEEERPPTLPNLHTLLHRHHYLSTYFQVPLSKLLFNDSITQIR